MWGHHVSVTPFAFPAVDRWVGVRLETRTESVRFFLADVRGGFDVSVTCTENGWLPDWVGTPVIAPVAGSSARPGGGVPVHDHVSGPVPPDAASCAEYALPAVAAGNDVVVTAGVGTVHARAVSSRSDGCR